MKKLECWVIQFVALIIILPFGSVKAQGYDDGYEVKEGDFNSDGKTDILVSKKKRTSIIAGDINIPIALPNSVDDSVLVQSSGGSDFLLSDAALFDVTGATNSSTVTSLVGDFNFDGNTDVSILNLGSISEYSGSVVLFASDENRQPPEFKLDLDDNAAKFWSEVVAWGYNVDYFDTYAPKIAVGASTGSAVWSGAVAQASNLLLINVVLALCEAAGGSCGVSSVDPPNCTRTVQVLDSSGNVVGVQTVNVCDAELHIYSWPLGSVTIEPDYSVFDQDARDYAEEIESRTVEGIFGLGGLSEVQLEGLAAILKGIVNSRLGPKFIEDDEPNKEAALQVCEVTNIANEFPHDPLPGDSQWSENDPTFHHYDVETVICDSASDPQCSKSAFESQVLPSFSFPSFMLRPRLVAVDQEVILVYVTIPPLISVPEAYVVPFGYITQEYISDSGAPWDGGIRNITTQVHAVYPGTISRFATTPTLTSSDPNSTDVGVFTHGIGLNEFLSPWTSPLVSPLPVPGWDILRPIHLAVACRNDYYGPITFKTLDGEAREFWNNLQSSGSGGQSAPGVSSFSDGVIPVP